MRSQAFLIIQGELDAIRNNRPRFLNLCVMDVNVIPRSHPISISNQDT
jgi:hypothetical protein